MGRRQEGKNPTVREGAERQEVRDQKSEVRRAISSLRQERNVYRTRVTNNQAPFGAQCSVEMTLRP